MKKTHALFILLVPFFRAVLYAQGLNAVPSIQFDRIPSELGLSQNLISAILQDHKGFLWFGTKDGLNRFDGYKFTVYRQDPYDSTSLSDNRITALCEDRAGRIWVGTLRGGLNLFDRDTETFSHSMPDSANSNSLSHSRITAIAEDEKGDVWVGTWGGGVNRLVLPAGAKTLAKAAYMRFMHDPNNPNSLGNNIISVSTIAKDTVWVVTNFAGHYQIIPTADRRNFEVRPAMWGNSLPNPEWGKRLETNVLTYAFGQGKNGKAWIGMENGFLCWDAISGEYTFHGLAAKNFMGLNYSFLEDRTGILWAGHSQGLRRYDLTAGTFADLRHDPNNPHSIAESGINAIYEDSGGILWFGSNGNGLFKYDSKVAPFSRPHRGAAQLSLWRGTSIRALLETRDPAPAVLWLSAASGALLRLNRATGEMTRSKIDSPDGFGLEFVFSMLQDRKGVMWVGNTIGLHRLEWREGKLKAISHYEPESDGKIENLRDGVFKIFEDQQGEIWIATITHFARLDQHNRRFVKYRFSAAEPSTVQEYAYPFIHQDRRGRFWLGTLDGLQRFDPATASFKRYQNDPADSSSLSFNVVRAIHEDPFQPDKYLWLGTGGGGLNRFDLETETFKHFTEKDGLPDNVIYAILSDSPGFPSNALKEDRGNLWMSTNKGLSKFNPRTHQFKNYDVKDGLQDNEFNSCAYFKSSSGELFFGGIGGFNAFYPEDIQGNQHVPPVVITDFQIFNKSVSFESPKSEVRGPGPVLKKPITETEEITLSYEHKVFSFEFAALDYTDPAKNRYAYKMENFDRDWQQAGTSRTATYTNLDPGKYVFRVKASNNDGVWNEAGAAIRIKITPPWWRTWWAYGMYALLFVAGVFAADRFQRRRVIANERVQTEIREADLRAQTAEAQSQALQAENERKEVELRKAEELKVAYQALENALENLKATQQQLVMQQKLASLGQLTAGIAHEIKNPLNFVNNFAQLSAELTDEFIKELDANADKTIGEVRGALEELLADLRMNNVKINEHGKRADSIVRSMMQHARAGKGERQLTDVNALVEEYVNLTYHGMRAKVPDFNVSIERDFGRFDGKIEMVPQDIGRVLLNLLANAFDAVREQAQSADGSYAPKVTVSTRAKDGGVEIRVRDNGGGIPDEVREKIFEPFFTTKPTGSGTGLGLSLSYDIVTQGHAGALMVESTKGNGATFIITLPAR